MLSDQEAYRFILSLLLRNARGDDEGLDLLAEQATYEDLPMLLKHALSVAYAAYLTLAAVTEIPFNDQIEALIFDAAAE